MKTNRLRSLKIDELSLVDRPANQLAHSVLHKRDEPGILTRLKKWLTGEEAEPVDLSAETEALAVSVASILDDPETLAKRAALQTTLAQFSTAVLNKHAAEDTQMSLDNASVADLELALQKRKAAPVAAEDGDGEDPETQDDETAEDTAAPASKPKGGKVAKTESEALAKADARAAAAEERIQKMEQERAHEKLMVSARVMIGKADITPDALVTVLAKLDTAEAKVVEDLLKKHNTLLKDSKLFDAQGSDSEDSPDVETQVMAKVEELRKSFPKLTEQQAIAKVLELHPELYAASLDA